MLGNHLYQKSVMVKWVNISMPHKRNCRFQDYSEIQHMAKHEPDSYEIFEESLLESYYLNRTKELEAVCLFDLVAN